MAFQDFCNSRRRFLADSIMLCSTAACSICYGCQSTFANGSHDMQSETNPRLFSFVGEKKGIGGSSLYRQLLVIQYRMYLT